MATVVAQLSLVLLSLAAPLGAQAIVKGTLYNDSTGVPIRGTVMFVDPRTDAPVVHVIADSAGGFRLAAAAGVYQLAAVRDGFTSTLSAPMSLQNGERLTVRVPMALLGSELWHRIGVLEHVRPEAAMSDRPGPELEYTRYEFRRSSGSPGLRYDHSEITRSGAHSLGEFLQRLPGLDVHDSRSGSTVEMARSSSHSGGLSRESPAACRVGWFLDGHRMDIMGSVDPMTDMLGRLTIDDVDGVEVFRGPSELPIEFAAPELRCGAVAIWTRRG